jgi:hypothetical protein
MDYNKFGILINKNKNLILINKPNSSFIYRIETFDNHNKIQFFFLNKEQIILSLIDNINDKNDLSSFTRIIKHQEYIFKNGELKIKKLIKKNIISKRN